MIYLIKKKRINVIENNPLINLIISKPKVNQEGARFKAKGWFACGGGQSGEGGQGPENSRDQSFPKRVEGGWRRGKQERDEDRRGLAKGGDIIFAGGRPTSKYSPRARTCHSTPLLPFPRTKYFSPGRGGGVGMVERGGFRADRNLKSAWQREAVVSLITAGLKTNLKNSRARLMAREEGLSSS